MAETPGLLRQWRIPQVLSARRLGLPPEEQAGTNGKKFWRIVVPKSVWGQVLNGLNDERDFDNFKSEVARHQGTAGAAYERSLHDVWSVMHRLQR